MSSGTRWRDALFVIAIGALGIAIDLQGWRSRTLDLDLAPVVSSAHEVWDQGRLPDRGVLSSLGSYVPPGATWIAVPGVAVFSDPRLAGVPGSAALYLGTLVGVLLLARRHFGLRAAYAAVAVYGLSSAGVSYASWFGPRGHPFFFVWMVFAICEWVHRRSALWLGASLVVWSAGMFVFMELAPAIFIVPVVWLVYRPPVRIVPIVVAAVCALVMWSPYLRFQRDRGFVDLKSQMFVQDLTPAVDTQPWCDAALPLRQTGPDAVVEDASALMTSSANARVVSAVGRRVLAAARGLVANFEGALIPGTEILVLAITALGLGAIALGPRAAAEIAEQAGWPRWARAAAAVTLVSGAVAAFWWLAASGFGRQRPLTAYSTESVRVVGLLLLLGAAVILARRLTARAISPLVEHLRTQELSAGPLALSLVVPWGLLLLLTEHGRGERLSFLWPVQAALVAFALAAWLPRAEGRAPTYLRLVVAAILVSVIAGPVVHALEQVRGQGWAGTDSAEVRVAGRLADSVLQTGRTRAAIGYQVAVPATWGSRFAAADGRYKFGAEFDLLLRYPHAVTNTNMCAEGVSPSDEYRVVSHIVDPGTRLEYFNLAPDPRFLLLETVGPYEILQRR